MAAEASKGGMFLQGTVLFRGSVVLMLREYYKVA